MSLCVLFISDGRDDVHKRARRSLRENLPAPYEWIEVDDREHMLGFSGAIAEAWRLGLETDCDYFFHAEADFTYNEPVQIEAMEALASDEHIAQVALKRQSWNPQEIAAGGIVETDPDSYHEGVCCGGRYFYTAHRKFFTTNPSIYRREIAERGWPQEANSEGKFGISLFEDPHVVSTFWGGKFDPPKVTHIGDIRAGKGY